ncbi:MAG: FecR domain-containing protein [Nitrospinae bacterium]|nr:FecR domain-containing protein [Nitrospinota bacterium]
MNKFRVKVAAMSVFAFFLLFTGHSWSAPIKAKAVYVEGSVNVISIADSKMRAVARGDTFAEGDRIKTSANGTLEVEFDTGDIIRLDKNSDLVIKALNRNSSGSTFSIFSLMIGRVKSAVSKLADSSSKFEYHTKAAVCGVSGTPPFVVETTNGETSVDLLGEPGEKGAVYVRGMDPAGTMVMVFSGNRSIVNFGAPPLAPFLISPERRQYLNRTISFKTAPKAHQAPEAKRDGPATKEEAKEIAADNKSLPEPGGANDPAANLQPDADLGFRDAIDKMTLNNLSGSVSVPTQLSPEDATEAGGAEQLGNQDQGVIGEQTTTSGADAPPPATSNVQIRIRLK